MLYLISRYSFIKYPPFKIHNGSKSLSKLETMEKKSQFFLGYGRVSNQPEFKVIITKKA